MRSMDHINIEWDRQCPTDTGGGGIKEYETETGARRVPFTVHTWLVRPELNQIEHRHRDEVRRVEPRLMKLLCILAANPGQLLERDRLVADLWPRVIVNENSLTRAVSELRKILRDSDNDPRQLIQTIPKKGYRLRAEVGTPDSPVRSAAVPITAGFLQSPGHRVAAGVIAACMSLVLGVGFLASNELNLPGSEIRLADELIHQDSGFQAGEIALSSTISNVDPADLFSEPALSVDGKRYALIVTEPEGFTIYVGDRHSQNRPIAVYTSQTQLTNLTWSPVGNALLFARDSGLKPAVIRSEDSGDKELLSLDLETGILSRLIEDDENPDDTPERSPAVNLTALQPAAPTATSTFSVRAPLDRPA